MQRVKDKRARSGNPGSFGKSEMPKTLCCPNCNATQFTVPPKSPCHPNRCATQIVVPPKSLCHGASLGAYPKASVCLRARTCSLSPKTPHEGGSNAKPTCDAPKASCPPNPRLSPTGARCVRGCRACRGRGRMACRDPQPLLGAGRRRSPSVTPAQAEASDGPAARAAPCIRIKTQAQGGNGAEEWPRRHFLLLRRPLRFRPSLAQRPVQPLRAKECEGCRAWLGLPGELISLESPDFGQNIPTLWGVINPSPAPERLQWLRCARGLSVQLGAKPEGETRKE